MRHLSLLSSAALFASLSAGPAAADERQPARIQWFGTLEQGLAEAERTGRPILLTSAAPHCGGVAGMW